MRKEEKQIVGAFLLGTHKKAARTFTDGTNIYLHGHKIAWKDAQGDTWATLAGWPTPTTRSRLNALCDLSGGLGGLRFVQINREQVLILPNGDKMPIGDNDEINLSAYARGE